MKNFLVLFVLLLAFASSLHAGTKRIDRIVINGASRTSHAVIMELLGVHPGMDLAADESPAAFTQRIIAGLYRMRVFSKANAVLVQTTVGQELVISLEEKWTLLPMPFAAAYQKKLTLGLGVIESNFLGSLNPLGAFFFLQGGTPGFFAFSSWSFGSNRNWTLRIAPQWMGRDIDLREDRLRVGTYSERIGGASFSLGWGFVTGWQLSLGLDALHYQFKTVEGEGGFDAGLSFSVFPVTLTLSYTGQRVIEDRMAGIKWQFGLMADTGFFASGERRMALTAGWQLALPAGSSLLFVFEQRAALAANQPFGLEYRIGGRSVAGVPALLGYFEDQFRTSAWCLSLTEARLPIWTTSGLIGSLVPFAQYALFEDILDGRVRGRFSMGMGFRIYLRKIHVPAFSLYAAWAEGNGAFSVGVSAGMNM